MAINRVVGFCSEKADGICEMVDRRINDRINENNKIKEDLQKPRKTKIEQRLEDAEFSV